MKTDTVTLRYLTKAFKRLDAARNSTDNGFVADHVDEALAAVKLAMRGCINSPLVRRKDERDDECSLCGGRNVVCCTSQDCPYMVLGVTNG